MPSHPVPDYQLPNQEFTTPLAPLQPPKRRRKFGKPRYLSLAVITLIATTGLAAGAYLVQQNQDVRQQAAQQNVTPTHLTSQSEISVCTLTTNGKDWIDRDATDLPTNVDVRSLDHAHLPPVGSEKFVQQTALTTSGVIWTRYLLWTGTVYTVSSDWSETVPSGKPPMTKPNQTENFRSFDQVLFPDNRLKQTYLSADGKKVYYRYIQWNGSAWNSPTTWSSQSTTDPGQQSFPTESQSFRSYDHVVFPDVDGATKLRQSILDESGYKLYIRYFIWNGSSWDSTNELNFEFIDRGFPEPLTEQVTPAYQSYDFIVLDTNQLKHTVVGQGFRNAWVKYQLTQDCLPSTVVLEDAGLNLYAGWHKFGVYDPVSNKTFISFSGGVKDNYLAYSDTSPYVTYYDHTTQSAYPNPIKIFDVPFEDITEDRFADNHLHPDITMDQNGYLHLIHSYHVCCNNLTYAKSTNPRDITSWQVRELPGTERNTYIKLFNSNDNHLFALFRQSECWNNNGCNRSDHEAFIWSQDGGNTWSSVNRLIETPTTSVSQVTYVNNRNFDPVRNGLHLTWFYLFDDQTRQTMHYAFFDFDDRVLYTAGGQSLGSQVNTGTNDHALTTVYSYPSPTAADHFASIALDTDAQGRPHLIHRFLLDPTRAQTAHTYWNGTSWVGPNPISLFDNQNIAPHHLLFNTIDDFVLFAPRDGESVYDFTVAGSQLTARTIFTSSQPIRGRFDKLSINLEAPNVRGYINDGFGTGILTDDDHGVPGGIIRGFKLSGDYSRFMDIPPLSGINVSGIAGYKMNSGSPDPNIEESILVGTDFYSHYWDYAAQVWKPWFLNTYSFYEGSGTGEITDWSAYNHANGNFIVGLIRAGQYWEWVLHSDGTVTDWHQYNRFGGIGSGTLTGHSIETNATGVREERIVKSGKIYHREYINNAWTNPEDITSITSSFGGTPHAVAAFRNSTNQMVNLIVMKHASGNNQIWRSTNNGPYTNVTSEYLSVAQSQPNGSPPQFFPTNPPAFPTPLPTNPPNPNPTNTPAAPTATTAPKPTSPTNPHPHQSSSSQIKVSSSPNTHFLTIR